MRMVCDTPAILDPTCRLSPKLEVLEGVLSDPLEEPGRKGIVFRVGADTVRGPRTRRRNGRSGLACAPQLPISLHWAD
jgi:hypothetical protein